MIDTLAALDFELEWRQQDLALLDAEIQNLQLSTGVAPDNTELLTLQSNIRGIQDELRGLRAKRLNIDIDKPPDSIDMLCYTIAVGFHGTYWTSFISGGMLIDSGYNGAWPELLLQALMNPITIGTWLVLVLCWGHHCTRQNEYRMISE